jgi:hypothetical protein
MEHEVMAHPPTRNIQNVSVALYCTGGLPPGFLFQSAASAQGKRKLGKGKLFPLPGPVQSVHTDDRMDELDFQSALHVFIHPDTGLAVGIVKRPGTELVDIALIVPQYAIHGLGVTVTGGVDHRKRKKLFSFVFRLLHSR